ncbi:MAG TPA: hypothetical protein VMW72_26160 [Sedimentisphaerales bacterium]|nr:hypothetical protein [Sedimentisphaerales bacterium]
MGKKKKRTTKRKNKGEKRAGAKKGSKKRRKEKVNKKKELCPLQIRIVELIEVITHNGKEYSVQGPAKKPRKPPKTIQGNIKRKDKDKGAYKQYINLDNKVEKSKAHPEYGQFVRLKARVEWVDKKKKDSLAGKKVYWSSKADPGNKTGLTGSEKENFYSSEISMLGSPRYSEIDKDGWTKVVEFKFSQYGGDKFRIFAQADEKNEGKGSGRKLRAGWYVVWRRVYYEVDCMKRPSGASTYANVCEFNKVEGEYERHFVELVTTGSDSSPAHKRAVSPRTFAAWKTYAGSMRNPPAGCADRYVHVIVLDTVGANRNPQTKLYQLSNLKGQINITGANEAFNPDDWFQGNVSLTCYKMVGAVETAQPKQNVPSPNDGKKLKLTTTGGNQKDYAIQYDFTNILSLGAGPNLPSGVTKLELAISIVHYTPLSGLAWGDSTAVAIRWRERTYSGNDLKNSTSNTFIHEIGHNLGLAPKFLADGTERNSPGSWYYKDGAHCHELSNKCVMWESNLTKYKFCSKCGDGLKGRKLKTLPIRGDSPI